MDDMDMAMAMVDDDLGQNQMMLAMTMCPGSSKTSSSTPAAAAPPAARGGGSSSEDNEAATATGTTAGDLLRRGPWTVDEDMLLVNYIAAHGEGRWNALARAAGLRRTGKSCRLRWLNYLRPDVRRGNITAGEQLLILELHARWGNRWSKIAHQLPGRTDNEVKNYWRTRVQKHAKQLKCDVNSAAFRHLVRHLWMPRLRERAAAAAAGCGDDDGQVALLAPPPPAPAPVPVPVPVVVVQAAPAPTTMASAPPACYNYYDDRRHLLQPHGPHHGVPAASEPHHRQYYSEPAGQTAAAAATAALSPDDASSALRPASSFMADSSLHYAVAYTSAATPTPTPTNEQGCGPTTATDATAGDDDMFAGTTWSELLATTASTGGPDDDSSSTSMSMIGLPDFGFSDLDDGLWNLDDLCLQQLC